MNSSSIPLAKVLEWYFKALIILLGSLASSTVIQTTHGPIEGKSLILFNGKEVEAFLGVPFAAPPIGTYRFAPPQPLKRWNKPLAVKSLPKSCIQTVPPTTRQTTWFADHSEESEDCLYLNMWVPKNSTDVKKAVLVWIHGGGFSAGSSSIPLFDGSILASENNVIVASMNYRLSVFGFLYLNNTGVLGNAGLQDQIRAVKWIKDNCQFFGGDHQKITLFGESAGSLAVSVYMVNKNLDRLFQYGIMESGSFNSVGAVKTKNEIFNTSVFLAKSLNCSVDDLKDTLRCLREKSVTEILNSDTGIHQYARRAYVPVANGFELPVNINEAARSIPQNKRKNLLAGNLQKEINGNSQSLFPRKLLTENYTFSVNEMRDLLKNAKGISDRRLQDIILHEYRSFDGKYNRSQLRNEATEILSDMNILCPELEFVKDWATGRSQVYYYYFTRRPSKEYERQVPEWIGAVHGAEIAFVFGRPLDTANGYSAADADLSRKMMTYWTNFAKTGNPNGNGSAEMYWPPFRTEGNMSYLVLGLNTTVRASLKEKECDFWKNIYPSILTIQGQLSRSSSSP